MHNFLQRKKYLQKVLEKNRKVKQQVDDEATAQTKQHEIDEELKAQKEFVQQISNMHHLVGTKLIRSVFDNPYEPEENKTRIWGVGIEDHIKLQFKTG
eukprot:CAMPEP_0116943174 /NCGR_PEP_ID=MMETSP0467-20121206/35037_1 /TAXON_ID=283647 /ORGANISM="Mesodinium pulex, Strain SPMC105" /LENGTH=97 /DNA_ID=CAMNT_0004626319 /DNA_START=262 /DNA_END=555 /DNA_ORIENTATION=-